MPGGPFLFSSSSSLCSTGESSFSSLLSTWSPLPSLPYSTPLGLFLFFSSSSLSSTGGFSFSSLLSTSSPLPSLPNSTPRGLFPLSSSSSLWSTGGFWVKTLHPIFLNSLLFCPFCCAMEDGSWKKPEKIPWHCPHYCPGDSTVLCIRDILVRIRISWSEPLTYGSGSCSFR